MKRLYYLLLLLAVACTPKPQAAPQYEELDGYAIAVQSVINMREDPDYAAEMGTQAMMGTPLKLHHEGAQGYWSCVETSDGYKAWCNEMAVRRLSADELSAWKQSRRVIVTSYYTFFLDAPRADACHVSDACWGCIAQYLGTEGAFTKVLLPGGTEAYVPSSDVEDFDLWAHSRKAVVGPDASAEALSEAQQAIISTAKAFLGVPYCWGGTSMKGVDCSGLAKTVYLLNGYILKRNASQQYKGGLPVDVSQGIDNLQPADLVFFGREATADSPERITHVGIYLGDGQIIHSSQVVRINNVVDSAADNYYSRKIIRACRILAQQDRQNDVTTIPTSGVYFE